MRELCLLTFFSCCWSLGQFLELHYVDNCGVSKLPEGRIVGGTHSYPGEFPWMVSIQNGTLKGTPKHLGSIINENWILTTASCFTHNDNNLDYRVVVGLHRLSEFHQEAHIFQVSKIVKNADYNPSKLFHDLALLKTDRPIDFASSGGYVNSICLPMSYEDPTGYVEVIGWGYTSNNGTVSDILNKVMVPTVTREDCRDMYGKQITANHICAGADNKDACFYDGGGPLFKTDEQGVSSLIGLTSYGGQNCGEATSPGVYTKVYWYKDWIDSIVSQY